MSAKKGSWVGFVLHPTFETVMAVAILLVMLTFIHNLGQKTSFEKRFLATDIALVLDTIPAMPQPGNLWLLYVPQRNLKFGTNYGFAFSQGRVEVTAQQSDKSPISAYYISDMRMPVSEAAFPYQNAMIAPLFLKQGKGIGIRNSNERAYTYSREFLSCDGPEYRGALAVSPVHASGTDAAAEQSIAQLTKGLLGPQSGTEGVLAIKLGTASGDAAVIKAYVNAENTPALLAQSQRLGCELANAVLQQLDKQGVAVSGVAVIPVNPDQTASADDNALSAGKVGVLFAIDTKSSALRDDIAQQRMLAFALKDGVSHA